MKFLLKLLLSLDCLFSICRLTETEKKNRDYKKTVLEIAKEHEKARELERIKRYRMPEDQKVN